MKAILQQLADQQSLSEESVIEAMESIFEKKATNSEIAAFLMALKIKGETAEELTGLVKAIRKRSKPFATKFPNVLDNCGTGGDGSKSFNISTTSAFVIAGAGIPVAKHGNRSISSKTGSADVLEELGISLDYAPDIAEELLDEAGICFMFAPNVHPNMKEIMKVRSDLRIPTIFNLIGPLTNPVPLEKQLIGIYREDYLKTFAEVLKSLGRKRAIVLHGAGGMDEASLIGENKLVILEDSSITEMTLHPADVGLPTYSAESIIGGNAAENAAILKKVLRGEHGPFRDTVLLNAGLGIFTGGGASTIQEGIKLAKESIDSGEALQKLLLLKDASKKYKQEVI
ncbi:anthranilate phosphoribosyltransferase [Cytobacillus gottheilii]|uniref:Anthranilate phosphoribosyltransferase n=1 Tax=Cytobacillus gottheilii TaxID=859144 RepID=A0ABX8F6K8_9BACI|nr:anthranilate phosphoribosyltransferase [Cytobacillus gottheilii]QVY59984.1 anthranilate phosphoribosyltransferase [Cytobacillus gottheilii]